MKRDLQSLFWKITFVQFQSVTMVSSARPQRHTVAEAVEMIFDDGSEHGGMDSGVESELDRELENLSEESR